jgi:hypothetical protein
MQPTPTVAKTSCSLLTRVISPGSLTFILTQVSLVFIVAEGSRGLRCGIELLRHGGDAVFGGLVRGVPGGPNSRAMQPSNDNRREVGDVQEIDVRGTRG